MLLNSENAVKISGANNNNNNISSLFPHYPLLTVTFSRSPSKLFNAISVKIMEQLHHPAFFLIMSD